MLERPKFYTRFLEKYRIKNQIRLKQIENCLQHEKLITQPSELETYSTNNNQDLNVSCSYKKSVEDFKARLKFNEPPQINTMKTSSSSSNILDILSPLDESNKMLMSPIGFAKNEDKKYENSIYSKISFINRKHSEASLHKVSPERSNLGVVFDDGGKTEALIRRKYDRKKNKSEIDLNQKYIRGGADFEINLKAALSQRNNSKHYDKVDLALLKNNEYFDDQVINSNQEKKEVIMKIRTMQDKKMFLFPKIIGGQNGVS